MLFLVRILLCSDIQRNNLYLREILSDQTDLDKQVLTPPKHKKVYKYLIV
jgi:hypothetical protein